MNLSSFEYFIEVEKHRSFSKAAETLHISQQALSSHRSSLEKAALSLCGTSLSSSPTPESIF